jgi:hypothetical protein
MMKSWKVLSNLYVVCVIPLGDADRFLGIPLGASIQSTKARQEDHKKEEAAAVNKTLLSIDYTSVYAFNNLLTYPYSIQFQKISQLETIVKMATFEFKKPKVRISN